MFSSLNISAQLKDDRKSCSLTYSGSFCQLQIINCDLPKTIAVALESPIHYTTELGTALYELLDGNNKYLTQARELARRAGEPLLLRLKPDAAFQELPFELLHDDHFLLSTGEIHLVRQVSERVQDNKQSLDGRVLKLLFMACSPSGLEPELDFEREEEAIYGATDNLAIEIVVEDSGSLSGLAEKISKERFDIIHISGHASIDQFGTPFFWMESDEGLPQQVTPSELWQVLRQNRPSVLFLAGCQTGQADPNNATGSFAGQIVIEGIPAVLGWGRPVYDIGATEAAKHLYSNLSRGNDLNTAIVSCRRHLAEAKHFAVNSVWPILRLFADGTAFTPIVKHEVNFAPTPRKLTHAFLEGSQIKILTEGFVGRRQQIQQGLRTLRHAHTDPINPKVGLLLHGTAGLGKSCLAGKLIERIADKETSLVVIHGRLDAMTFEIALRRSFERSKSEEATAILEQKIEMIEKIQQLCDGQFKKKQTLILFDDFEQNFIHEFGDDHAIPVFQNGQPTLEQSAVTILESLLNFLPSTVGKTKLIITSRYLFQLKKNDVDLVSSRLTSIGLTSFRNAGERKKADQLIHLNTYYWWYIQPQLRSEFIAAAHGNPRLLEFIDKLIGEMKGEDVSNLLAAIRNKQESFVRDYILLGLIKTQSVEFNNFLRHASVYRVPIDEQGLFVLYPLFRDHLYIAISLGLIENDAYLKKAWVSPLLRERLFNELTDAEQIHSHSSAWQFYRNILNPESLSYFIEAEELIYHAIFANEIKMACSEGAKLVKRLHEALAYFESKRIGELILANLSEVPEIDDTCSLYNELGYTFWKLGDHNKAISYFEQAFTIGKRVFGYDHPDTATYLNNIGDAFRELGDYTKAIDHYEQALSIYRKTVGDQHSRIALVLRNLSLVHHAIGDYRNAIIHGEQALILDQKLFGDQHSDVAFDLNNLGGIWFEVGEMNKAVSYFEQALNIQRRVFGNEHPNVAICLNNLGGVWSGLGENEKAINYYEQALEIDRKVLGDLHPNIAIRLNNLGGTWLDLGQANKALNYHEEALAISRKIFGEEHPDTAKYMNNVGTAWLDLGEPQKAIECFKAALAIDQRIFGTTHPNLARNLNNLAMAFFSVENYSLAFEYLKQAYEIYQKFHGENSPQLQEMQKMLRILQAITSQGKDI